MNVLDVSRSAGGESDVYPVESTAIVLDTDSSDRNSSLLALIATPNRVARPPIKRGEQMTV